jgi:NADPH:quinone reductase-like Zn-dependent oxidoreductase
MRAYAIQSGFGLDHLRFEERPEPQPGHGEVAVAVRAVSLNYRDLLVTKGIYNPKLQLPRIPCSDGAGEVVAVGAGVTRVKPGDRVCGIFMQNWIAGDLSEQAARSALGGEIDGMLAERVVLSQEGVVKVPEHLGYEEAATLPCAAVTAWHALTSAGVKAGDAVLVQGTGGVSMFATQFARVMGLRVLQTSGSDAKLDRLRNEFGVADVVNYKTRPDWEKWARERTDGMGVDEVVEVGGAGTLEHSLRAVRTGGHVSLIGVLSGGAGTINPIMILMRNVCVQGIFVGSRAHFEAMNRAIALHKIKPVVDRVFAFGEAVEALQYLESGHHVGKVVIRVG